MLSIVFITMPLFRYELLFGGQQLKIYEFCDTTLMSLCVYEFILQTPHDPHAHKASFDYAIGLDTSIGVERMSLYKST